MLHNSVARSNLKLDLRQTTPSVLLCAAPVLPCPGIACPVLLVLLTAELYVCLASLEDR